MLDRKGLNELFCGCDCAIWTSPTISFFEALGTGLKILIPYGSATSHLSHELISFYGFLNSNIEYNQTTIKKFDKYLIEEINDYILNFNVNKKRNSVTKYASVNIVQKLIFQYNNVLLNK